MGQRLRTLREERGLTQERLAPEAGVHRTFVGKVERGESTTTVDTLAVFCSALGVTLAGFFEPFSSRPRLRGPRRRGLYTCCSVASYMIQSGSLHYADLTATEYRSNDRDNPYLFRDVLIRLLDGRALRYRELTA